MTTKDKLQQELEDLKVALKNKLISVNEYCDFYHATWQKLKSLPCN